MNVFAAVSVSAAIAAVFAAAPAQLRAAADEPAGVHVPADKRHMGQSRYDLLPFTDRRKGEPDRYRAVNPNFVKKVGGRYYYLLDAQPGTRYFDDALKDRGALPETDGVPVELSRTKEGAKGADGKTRQFVHVRDRGWVPRDALPTAAEVRSGKWFRFPLKPGHHTLYDGTGIARGTLAAPSVRLNYGQQKQIGGERHYYAFSTSIVPDGETRRRGASGWIRASAIEDGHDPGYSAEVVARMQPSPTPPGDRFTPYEVTGGDPEERLPGGGGYRFGYADEKGAFAEYKVLPGVPRTENVAATDYLKRSDGVVNLGYNAAGVSNDTYRVAGSGRPLTFHRSADPHATVVIDLFRAKDATHDGLRPAAKMQFVYGYIDEGNGAKRWGWIPLGALRPKPAPGS